MHIHIYLSIYYIFLLYRLYRIFILVQTLVIDDVHQLVRVEGFCEHKMCQMIVTFIPFFIYFQIICLMEFAVRP